MDGGALTGDGAMADALNQALTDALTGALTLGPELRSLPLATPAETLPTSPEPPEDVETAPNGFTAATPNVARMCNYFLGGKDHFAADRDLAERVLRTAPIISRLVRVNRAFLHHTARFLAEQVGIRQFVDLGCGLPTDDNLDDVVRRTDPSCRVAYVDNDPMVLSHARALLAVNGTTAACEVDLREPGAVLGHRGLRRLIDFDEPVGVFLLGVLHFITDMENPYRIVPDLLTGLPAGSHVVISHAERTSDLDAVSWLYQETDVLFTPRTRQEIADLSRDLELVPPYQAGLSFPHPGCSAIGDAMPLIGYIGRKPG